MVKDLFRGWALSNYRKLNSSIEKKSMNSMEKNQDSHAKIHSMYEIKF
jgi:hypothetical protein